MLTSTEAGYVAIACGKDIPKLNPHAKRVTERIGVNEGAVAPTPFFRCARVYVADLEDAAKGFENDQRLKPEMFGAIHHETPIS